MPIKLLSTLIVCFFSFSASSLQVLGDIMNSEKDSYLYVELIDLGVELQNARYSFLYDLIVYHQKKIVPKTIRKRTSDKRNFFKLMLEENISIPDEKIQKEVKKVLQSGADYISKERTFLDLLSKFVIHKGQKTIPNTDYLFSSVFVSSYISEYRDYFVKPVRQYNIHIADYFQKQSLSNIYQFLDNLNETKLKNKLQTFVKNQNLTSCNKSFK